MREALPQFMRYRERTSIMAPLPPNSTPRFRVHYTNAAKSHTMNIRTNDSPSALGVSVNVFMLAIAGILLPTTIDLVEFAAQGSNVFNSVVSGIEGAAYGGGVPIASTPATYVNFIGRSSDGRRVRLAAFGIVAPGGDFRWMPGENASVDSAIDALNHADNHFQAIGGLKPIWKQYANGGFNAYWQKELRP